MSLARWIPLYILLAVGAIHYSVGQQQPPRPQNAAKSELEVLLGVLAEGNRSDREMASAQLRECSEVLITRLAEIAAKHPGNQARKQGNNGGDFEKWNPSRALAMQLLGEMRTLRGISVALSDLIYKPEFLVVKSDEGLGQLRKQPAAFLLFQLGSPGVYALLEELEHRVNQRVSNDELATVLQVLQTIFGDRARAADFVTKYRTTSLESSQSEFLGRLYTELTRSP